MYIRIMDAIIYILYAIICIYYCIQNFNIYIYIYIYIKIEQIKKLHKKLLDAIIAEHLFYVTSFFINLSIYQSIVET